MANLTQTMFSKRESDVLLLLSKGLNSADIAAKLFITKETVKTHRKNIRRKILLAGIGYMSLVEFAIQMHDILKKSP